MENLLGFLKEYVDFVVIRDEMLNWGLISWTQSVWLARLVISYWGNLTDDKSLQMAPNAPKLHRTDKYTLNKR